ncbi:hypothetical protein [Virgibacillus profundi]|uniref:hypothetical protein n=1 Tax=Virgibacillus profundi TaxID=2024555 RepID=UPI0034E041E6
MKLRDSIAKLRDGTEKLRDGTEKLRDGTEKLRDSTEKLRDGTAKLRDSTTREGGVECKEKVRRMRFSLSLERLMIRSFQRLVFMTWEWFMKLR